MTVVAIMASSFFFVLTMVVLLLHENQGTAVHSWQTMMTTTSSTRTLMLARRHGRSHSCNRALVSSIFTSTRNRRRKPSCSFVNSHDTQHLIVRHGLLDEMTESGSANGSSSSSTSHGTRKDDDNDNVAFDTLLNDLVFSMGDVRKDIAKRLEECTNASFVAWLERKRDNAEEDVEEQQALQELLQTIQEVKLHVLQQQEQAKIEQASRKAQLPQSEPDGQEPEETADMKKKKAMSTADVLKAASKINQGAVGLAENSASDSTCTLISEAKSLGLATGYNSKGQMRVGGG